jgi:hypothetical protein
MYGIFQGTYSLSMWWTVIMGLITEDPWDLSKEALLIYFAVGILTFRKAPPWIAQSLLAYFGFQAMQYTIPVLEFLLPEFRPIYAELMGYYKFYLRTQLWARAVYLETLKRTKDLWRSLKHPLIGSDAKIDSPVNLKGLDYRFLDDGMFCQPVGPSTTCKQTRQRLTRELPSTAPRLLQAPSKTLASDIILLFSHLILEHQECPLVVAMTSRTLKQLAFKISN